MVKITHISARSIYTGRIQLLYFNMVTLENCTKQLLCIQILLQLCVRPTPIHRWDVPGLPKEFQLFIKRDDMTGSTLGGNKVTCSLPAKIKILLLYPSEES